MHFARAFLRLAATATLVACQRGDDAKAAPEAMPPAALPTSNGSATSSGDVRIESEDQGVDLWIINDTISSGLSPSALAKAKQSTDSASVKGSGFGASIERMVKNSVQDAIATRVGFPLSDIRGATYENGRIEFDWIGKPRVSFDNVKVNKKKLLESFKPADAQRFVDAVNARVRATGAR